MPEFDREAMQRASENLFLFPPKAQEMIAACLAEIDRLQEIAFNGIEGIEDAPTVREKLGFLDEPFSQKPDMQALREKLSGGSGQQEGEQAHGTG